jgi:outer membrane lipopolysaccharide assembly protein LptE/RlpB
MIIKKFIIISILLLLTSCGYETIYSKKNNSTVSINRIDLEGDKKISRKIISLTNIKENNSNDYAYNLTLISNKTIEAVSKNKSGNTSIYKTTINIEFYLKDPNDQNKIIKQKNFNSSFSYNNMDNKFDLSKYQKNIEENLINQIAEEITIFLNVQ